MFSGFENYFVLEKIFGQVDIFSGAELNALNIFWGNSQINLELKTACEVISMPKRWKQTQAERTHGVYVYFTLHCITALEVNFDDFGFDLNKPWEFLRFAHRDLVCIWASLSPRKLDISSLSLPYLQYVIYLLRLS